jgi:hypothetical protein
MNIFHPNSVKSGRYLYDEAFPVIFTVLPWALLLTPVCDNVSVGLITQ